MSDGRWKRPDSVPFPTVWRRFKGKKPLAGDEVPEFWIQDVTEDLLEEVIEHMVKFSLRDEPICRAARFLEDERSVREIKDVWREVARTYKVSLVALTQEKGSSKPKVVGANMLCIKYKGEGYDNSMCGEALKKLREALDVISRMDDLYQRYSVEEYMFGVMLSVDPAYRGQGIGEELLRARRDIGAVVGLKLTVTLFTAVQSQKLAERVGFDTTRVVPYDEYLLDGEPAFKNTLQESDVAVMKLMTWRLV